ncbi:cytochrome P450 3A8-like [Ylistrum balloti]|uniref:cytochrome P450 3A8-like n=1 Tax=Ylistrum balloti TaxID=509963 RepID=UPI002905A942|nr:cytochrome P450 3A8-like [Ylistrum balloti]
MTGAVDEAEGIFNNAIARDERVDSRIGRGNRISLSLVRWYNKRKIRELEEGGIQMIPSLPIIGSIHKLFRKGLIQTETAWLEHYGNVVGWYNGFILNVVIRDRTMISEVLVKKFNIFTNRWVPDIFPDPLNKGVSFLHDEEWKRVRSLLMPVFHTPKIRKMTASVNKCAASVTFEFEKAATADSTITPKSLFLTYALNVISTCGFGLDLDNDDKKKGIFYDNLQHLFCNKFNLSLILAVIIPYGDKILKMCDVSPFPTKAVQFIADETTQMIDKRRKDPKLRKDDLLQMLSDLSWEEHGNKTKLSTEEVNAQSFAFLIGAYETTGSCLQYIAYELALNQHVQNKLKNEIKDVVGQAEPNYNHLQDLKYTGYVINEALRKYPTLGRLSRHCSKSTTIQGVKIPKGAAVVIPIYHIHHNPSIYPDPEDFRPERFSPESGHKVDPMLFLPFGGGPRMCIGRRFAIMEMKLVLVHLMRKIRFVSCKETEPSPPQFLKSTPMPHTVNPIKIKVIFDQF